MKPRSKDDWIVMLDAIEAVLQFLRSASAEEIQQGVARLSAPTPERAPGGDALNDMNGKHAVDGISALLKDAEPLHRDGFEHLEPVPHIATLINNNQPSWTNIIETAPNVTIDVGTKLYDQKALFAVGVAMLEQGRKGGFEDGYIAGKAYQKHFASAPVADERADDGSLYLLGKWAAAFKSIVEQCAAPVDVSAQCDAVHFAYNTAKKALSAQPSGALERVQGRTCYLHHKLECAVCAAYLDEGIAPPPERAPGGDELPPFPSRAVEDDGRLQRWGVTWPTTDKILHSRMPDGYWTPWHLANEALRAASTGADATLRAALEKLRTNIDAGLLTALRNGGQLDMDGCEVRVSRQACEEAADHLEQLAALAGNEGEK